MAHESMHSLCPGARIVAVPAALSFPATSCHLFVPCLGLRSAGWLPSRCRNRHWTAALPESARRIVGERPAEREKDHRRRLRGSTGGRLARRRCAPAPRGDRRTGTLLADLSG